jgi:hypothetical protein
MTSYKFHYTGYVEDEYPLTKNFLAKHSGVLVDQSNFQLIERALGGHLESMDQVASSFINSEHGFPFHYGVCMDLAHRFYKLDQEHNDPVVILNDLNNFTIICAQAEDWKAAKEWQLKTIRHMAKNFEPEEWDYTHFDNMATILDTLA